MLDGKGHGSGNGMKWDQTGTKSRTGMDQEIVKLGTVLYQWRLVPETEPKRRIGWTRTI